MMDKDNREWRSAKMPVWVKESIEREMAANQLTAALSWPTEAKPEPVSFRWGDYDRLIGEVSPGVYWALDHGVKRIEIQRTKDLTDEDRGRMGSSWKSFAFLSPGSDRWSSSVVRGPLFLTEREARLFKLWSICETAARDIWIAKSKVLGGK